MTWERAYHAPEVPIPLLQERRNNPGKRVARGIRFVHYERMVSIVRRVSSTLMDSQLLSLIHI